MDGEDKSVTPPPPTDPAPQVRTLRCTGCGAPVAVRGLQQTEAVVCGACGAALDLTDEGLRVLHVFASQVKHEPLVPLGARGRLRGETFEVIGYLRRAITVEGVDYEWDEYLLFNPYKGFRWLTEYNGHWNYVKTVTHPPSPQTPDKHPTVEYLGQKFRCFQRAEARVTYALGEFYWKVAAGETCQVTDYVAPPLVLSQEKTDREVTWSVGEYMEPAAVWQAFGLRTPVPPRLGVAPNQVSPYIEQASKILKLLACLLLAAVGIQALTVLLSQNALVFEQNFLFTQADGEKAKVTEVFEVNGRPSNLVIRSEAPVDNNWLYLNLALINEQTGEAYDFGREIGYYHGRDSDGAWSEGRRTDTAVLPSVPPGRYYLRIEPDSQAAEMSYKVRVYRDVPRWTFFWVTVALIGLLMLFYWSRRRNFEYRRWQESDYPMRSLASSSDEE